jgi:phage tail sheath protein FI
MPEYLAPGVFVEEVSFRQKPIEGVSTSTTAFVGPTRDGPVFGEPPLLTSFQEFSEVYGGIDPLDYSGTALTNFVAHAVRAYFEEGGKRLYVARALAPLSGAIGDPPQLSGSNWSDGIARWSIDDDASLPGSPPDRLTIRARYPGAAGNRLVTFRFRMGPSILDASASPPALRGVERFEVAWVQTTAEAATSPPGAGSMYWVDRYFDPQGRPAYRLRRDDPANAPGVGTITDLTTLAQVRLLSATVEVVGRGRFRGRFDQPKTYEDLTFHPAALAPGARRSLIEEFAAQPSRRSTALFVPIVLETGFVNGVEVAEAIVQRTSVANTGTVLNALGQLAVGGSPTDDALSCRIELRGGNDGQRPDAGEYQGIEDPEGSGTKGGLLALEDLEDVSIVAAPGSSFAGLNGYAGNLRSITGFLLSHCERMRYRVAVLDSADGALPGEVRDQRASLDSKYGALYYPWVRAFDPINETQIALPPSGFVTGIYARNDVERGVHKAPANEVVRLATGFELLINKGQQEALNPLGINCLRFFEGRGYRVWGARTITSDPEWKYINLRRNFAYLGRSIEIGTQWAVFEPNAEELWSNVRRSVEDFLYNEWKNGRLMGVNPEEAYFVRCDRTTMTQSDIDNGRLICLVGVALLRPAEFVIFRIGQKTLDFKG